MSSLNKLVGDQIRELRQQQSLTQAELAANAGLTTRHVQYIEAGDQLPSIEALFKLAYGLDVHYSDILDGVWDKWELT